MTEYTSRQHGASRQLIVETLATESIEDRQGRATAILQERSGYPGTLTGLAALLKAMEASGTIERDLNGKRCYAIRLANGKPRPATPLSGACVSTPDTPPPEALNQTLDLDHQPDGGDVAAIAKALLEQVIDLAASPHRQHAELEQLRADHAELQQRLYDATQRAEKARQRVNLMEDELAARKVEIDGLRQRLRDTERNLTAILNSPSGLRLDVQRERELRELVHLMRTPPKAS